MRTGADQRNDERVEVVLPVHLDEADGVTNNFSASGISFDTDAAYQPGSEISFVLDIESWTEKKQLKCKGRVVRAETHDGRTSVAVCIDESEIEILGEK